jgi:ribosomal protein L14E/L6E/L27E
MGAIKPGLKVQIIKGADKGKEAIITEMIDKRFVKIKLMTKKGEKERRINVKHIKVV